MQRSRRDLLRIAAAVPFTPGARAALTGVPGASEVSPTLLHPGFLRPPNSARPWVYWFWVAGNVTSYGITADLEAMKRVGIGGVLIMDVEPGTPAGPVHFGSPEWLDLFKHACREANRLGLKVRMNNDAGWCGSGGPWITPALSMQKVVWSETAVQGPRHIDERLPQPETVAGYYRDVAVLAFPTPGNDAYRIADFRWKATFMTRCFLRDFPPLPAAIPSLSADCLINRDRILDLTVQCKDGHLSWDVPEGKWTVLRFGHTSTGVDNHPAQQAGQGLECDRLNPAAIETHFAALMGKLIADVGPLAGKTLVSTHIDSWESAGQNWTPRFQEEFQKRCQYDLLPFLPVMTGRVVDSLEISERFLWDLRKTISDLIVDNYAGRLRELANQHGLRLSIEGYDSDPVDDMSYASRADEPQAEFWFGRDPRGYRSPAWCANMTSVAHVYGKRIVAAEAFTAMDSEKWLAHPGKIKPLGDWAFCEGINRFIFHRYAMQPWRNRKPGMTMGPWGLHYERTQTWWEQSKPWHEYLARCQYLLRQGLFVADLCYLQPEGAPMRFQPPVTSNTPVPPDRPGYNFDGCTPEVVLTRMSVKDGRLVLPDGMSYALLVLPEPGTMPGAEMMTPRLLRRIAEFVEAGATVVGPRPARSPSLSAYPTCDKEVEAIATRLWGDCDGKTITEHRLGKGRVVWGRTPQQVLADMEIPPDFACGDNVPAPVRYVHRRMTDGTDLYFVANKENVPTEAVCTFRVSGRRPEFWWPETGRIERAAIYDEAQGCTRVPVRLNESESVFVLFHAGDKTEADRLISIRRNGEGVLDGTSGPRGNNESIQVVRQSDGRFQARVWMPGNYLLKSADGRSRRVEIPPIPQPLELTGPWDLRFPPNSGAPERVVLDKLISWSDHRDPGVRYFSGTATYRKHIHVPSGLLTKDRILYLDLGRVEVIAQVSLNGKDLGILWKPPYRIEVTNALQPGDNALEVKVVNLWPNRLIGDEQLPEDCQWGPKHAPGQALAQWPDWLLKGKPSPNGRFTFTTWKLWTKDSPLQESGLLGPVSLRTARTVVI